MANPIRKGKMESDETIEISDDKVNEILYPEISFQKRAENAESELKILREDYINRIAGMVKAVAAVERGRDRSADAVVYLEELIELGASGLIEEYRRTSARFRSAFPTSFGLGPFASRTVGKMKNFEDFK